MSEELNGLEVEKTKKRKSKKKSLDQFVRKRRF